MPQEAEKVVGFEPISDTDEFGCQVQIAFSKFAVQRAFQIDELFVSYLAAVPNRGQRRVGLDDLQDAGLDAPAIFLDVDLLPALAD